MRDSWRRCSQDVKLLIGSLKGIRCNNLYYLKDSSVSENLAASGHLEDNSTRLW